MAGAGYEISVLVMFDTEQTGSQGKEIIISNDEVCLHRHPNIHANCFAPLMMRAIPSRVRYAYLQGRTMVRTVYPTWILYFHGKPFTLCMIPRLIKHNYQLRPSLTKQWTTNMLNRQKPD